jgi:signal transduction histidine kinase
MAEGLPGRGRRSVRVFLAAVAWIATASGHGVGADDAPSPLRSIGQILSLPVEEFGRELPVVVRGVVTNVTPLVMQDGDDAIYLDPMRLRGEPGQHWQAILDALPIEVGAELEVTGYVDPGGYAPRIVMQSVQRLGTRPLPEPVTIDVARLFAGGDVGRRVRATGVVQGVNDHTERWSLVFESVARRFVVTVPKRLMTHVPDTLIDAEVEVVGVGNSFRNTRGEFIAPGLYVARIEDLRIIHEPVQQPFDLPITPLGAIARYRSQPLSGHRLRTTGVVSFAAPGILYLQEGVGGVRVDIPAQDADREEFQPGDRVEVAGFPDMSSGVGAIYWAVARRVSRSDPPGPKRIQPHEILRINDSHAVVGQVASPGSYDGCLIRCTGRIEAVNRADEPGMLTLTDQGTVFTAHLAEPGGPPLTDFVVGSEVEITGIVRMAREGSLFSDWIRGSSRIDQIGLLVRNGGDIRVERLPPWWTPRRLATIAGLLGLIAAAAIVWVNFLRREVARQTDRAVAEESARQTAALDYVITLRERNQLAANLHDTALQTVTGIAFQLKVCEAKERDRTGSPEAAAGDGEVGRHLGVARKMVEHAADQLRGTVWSLRSLPTDGRSFSEALAELGGRVGAGHAAAVRIDFDPRADTLPAFVAGNLLLVIQEALHNALHHAAPETVTVRVEADGGGGVAVDVGDDGRGFELGSQAGPREGHFGLAGMRERVERLGGTWEIDTAPSQGTRIRIVVPAEGSSIAAVALLHE